jgi:hypothetical protein
MKITKCIICFALVLGISIPVKAEEKNYWKPIRDAWESQKSDPNIGLKTQEYIKSLSPEQLMMAGRQCAEEFNSEFHRNGFVEGTGFLIGFFIYQYPKTAGLEDLRPIFKDIEDPNQTDMWRSTLIHAFGVDWSQKLSDAQLCEVVNTIDKILESKNIYYRVINEAIYTTKATLREIENRDEIKMSSANDVNVSNQEKKSKEIAEYYTRFSRRLLDIYSEPNLNPDLQMVSFALMRDILDKPVKTKIEVKNALADAVRNYERYDVKTWRLLSQIGIEKLQMPDGNEIAKAMTDKLEIRINNEPNNITKRPLQSELESIKRCTKTKINHVSK